MPSDADVAGQQGTVNTWSSVVGEASLNQPNLCQRVGINGGAAGDRVSLSFRPAVIAGRGHTQQSADDVDLQLGILDLLRLNVAEECYRSDRRAKKVNAFPWISSSSSFLASSRSSRALRTASDSPGGAAHSLVFSACRRLAPSWSRWPPTVRARCGEIGERPPVSPMRRNDLIFEPPREDPAHQDTFPQR